jgi:hypothetical protein
MVQRGAWCQLDGGVAAYDLRHLQRSRSSQNKSQYHSAWPLVLARLFVRPPRFVMQPHAIT